MMSPTPALHSLLSPGLVLLFFTSLSPPLYFILLFFFLCILNAFASPVTCHQCLLRASQPQPPGPESDREDAHSGFPPLSSYLASPCFASSSTAPPSPQEAACPLLSRNPCFDLTPSSCFTARPGHHQVGIPPQAPRSGSSQAKPYPSSNQPPSSAPWVTFPPQSSAPPPCHTPALTAIGQPLSPEPSCIRCFLPITAATGPVPGWAPNCSRGSVH